MSMGCMDGLGGLIYLALAAAEAVSVVVLPLSCGVIWCGKKVVKISERIDAENHPVGRTCLKVIGYAITTLGFLAGTAYSILLTSESIWTLGLLVDGPPLIPLGHAIGLGVAGIVFGVASACIIGRMFHRSLCELKEGCNQNNVSKPLLN